jgi:hypothetical protein
MTAEVLTDIPADTTIHPAWVRVCHWANQCGRHPGDDRLRLAGL